MNTIIEAFADLSRGFLIKNPNLLVEEAKQMLITMSPGFETDKLFHDIFPTVFMLEKCKFELNHQKAD